jgi:biopolymer transport protein ExbD
MRKRGNDKIETPVASLIDVVFLLIIFFLVTANLDKQVVDNEVQLADARYAKEVEKTNPFTVVINVRENGVYTTGAGGQRSLNEIRVWLSQIYGKHPGNNPAEEIPVLIRADANVKYKHISDLQDVITKAKFYKVKLAAVIN